MKEDTTKEVCALLHKAIGCLIEADMKLNELGDYLINFSKVKKLIDEDLAYFEKPKEDEDSFVDFMEAETREEMSDYELDELLEERLNK